MHDDQSAGPHPRGGLAQHAHGVRHVQQDQPPCHRVEAVLHPVQGLRVGHPELDAGRVGVPPRELHRGRVLLDAYHRTVLAD